MRSISSMAASRKAASSLAKSAMRLRSSCWSSGCWASWLTMLPTQPEMVPKSPAVQLRTMLTVSASRRGRIASIVMRHFIGGVHGGAASADASHAAGVGQICDDGVEAVGDLHGFASPPTTSTGAPREISATSLAATARQIGAIAAVHSPVMYLSTTAR
ncbi:hypothetical protein [Arthrobacter sp. H35-D1]|uniref:hypothetical protein n=1 Tax=Arthrobacter sp. H35-D1 TaxID=3046202 RepID=UPI0024BB5379|nr:hypothetical protein [Arthrobacter sp. H35-D1]MDJ0313973.1 hypothetical protein [Arthrobacter sp. H35-D1]